MTADMNNIAETGRGYHACLYAPVLQYCICSDCRAVENMRNICVGDAAAFAYFSNALYYRYGGVIRSTGDLVNCDFSCG